MKNKRRNLWMSATLMCSFFIVYFKFGSEGINWLWTDQKIIPLILGISAIIFGILWFLESGKKN